MLTKLQRLGLDDTQVSDAGCAALTAALESGVLPALSHIDGLTSIPASAAARAAVEKALDKQELTRAAAERVLQPNACGSRLQHTRVAAEPVHLVPTDTQFLVLVLVVALMLKGALVQGGYWEPVPPLYQCCCVAMGVYAAALGLVAFGPRLQYFAED